MTKSTNHPKKMIVFETRSPIKISIEEPTSREELLAVLNWLDRHARPAGLPWPEINEARSRALCNVAFSPEAIPVEEAA